MRSLTSNERPPKAAIIPPTSTRMAQIALSGCASTSTNTGSDTLLKEPKLQQTTSFLLPTSVQRRSLSFQSNKTAKALAYRQAVPWVGIMQG